MSHTQTYKSKDVTLSSSGDIICKPYTLMLSINQSVNLELLLEAICSKEYPDLLWYLEHWKKSGLITELNEAMKTAKYHVHENKTREL
jgi:hypothetical protein